MTRKSGRKIRLTEKATAHHKSSSKPQARGSKAKGKGKKRQLSSGDEECSGSQDNSSPEDIHTSWKSSKKSGKKQSRRGTITEEVDIPESYDNEVVEVSSRPQSVMDAMGGNSDDNSSMDGSADEVCAA